jgi:hypothetical protein
MNSVDQLLLDSLMVQMELNKLKKPVMGGIVEISQSGPVLNVTESEEDEMGSMFHEMHEMHGQEENQDRRFVDEGDYEGGMALVELNAIIDKATTITNMIAENTELPAWIQSKITLAAHNISAAHDLLKYRNYKC